MCPLFSCAAYYHPYISEDYKQQRRGLRLHCSGCMMRTPGPGLVMVTLAAVASVLLPITLGAAAGVSIRQRLQSMASQPHISYSSSRLVANNVSLSDHLSSGLCIVLNMIHLSFYLLLYVFSDQENININISSSLMSAMFLAADENIGHFRPCMNQS